MNKLPQVVIEDLKPIRRPEQAASHGEVIYRFTDRTEPRKSLHLLMIVRLENDRPVIASATASRNKPSRESLPAAAVIDLDDVRANAGCDEVFNRLARFVVP